MSNQYVSIHFSTSAERAEIISAMLLDAGFEGIEQRENETIASIKKDVLDEEALKEIMETQQVSYTTEIVEERNWNEEWEKSFDPVTVKDFAVIRAGFHDPIPGFKYEIIITPKMSFGTGHHATTYLMIQQMAVLDFTNKRVIDFGTGTAVLAILAEKLGASSVLATDNDEWSINNSIENIEANQCKNIRLLLADGFPVNELAEIILANINLNVIIANLPKIKASLLPKGKVLFSGLLKSDEKFIKEQLHENGYRIENVAERNGWICLLTSSALEVGG